MKPYLIVCGLSALVLLSGCGGGERQAEKKAEAPAAAAAPPPSAAEAATITGKVNFHGTAPAPRVLRMEANPNCARAHQTPPVSEEVVVNRNGTLRNVFVWVKAGVTPRQWAPPAGPVTIDQDGCIYKPHVVGVRTDQDLEFLNSDTVNHNIHPMPKFNREWNESQPPKAEKKLKRFDKEEVMIPVKCNVHPWMKTWIGVVSHPFFAVTGEDGAFKLEGLPAGEYTLEAWHEKYGAKEMKLTVGAKESKKVDFDFKG